MQGGGRRQARIIDSLEAARALFAPMLGRARNERLCVAHLNRERRLIGLRLRYAPADQPIDFPVRNIIADALDLGSSAVILAHNHPSGDPTPSATDLDATRSLVQVARPLGIAVRDHLVFSGDAVASFRQRGLL